MGTVSTDRSGGTPTSVANNRQSGLSSSSARKGPCIAASTTNLTLSGEQTINGIVCVDGDRVGAFGQTLSQNSGIYIVSTGLWERAADFNRNDDVVEGTEVRITRGTNAGLWVLTTQGDIVIGTTPLTFARDSTLAGSAVLQGNNGTDFSSRVGTLNNLFGTAVNIAAAATIDISDQAVMTGFYATISGNTGISGITMDSEQVALLRFTGTPLITISASLVGNNNAANIQIEAGDHALVRKTPGGAVHFIHLPVRDRGNSKWAAAVASAGTTIIPEGVYGHITGTTTITDVDFGISVDGRYAIVEFDGALTITNSSTLKCPGSADIVTTAGDVIMFVQDVGDTVRVVPLSPSVRGAVQTVAAAPTTDQNNYAIAGVFTGASKKTILILSPTISIKLTGVSTSGWETGKELIIRNGTSETGASGRLIILEQNSGSSLAANRFSSGRRHMPIMLMPGDEINLRYDGTNIIVLNQVTPENGASLGFNGVEFNSSMMGVGSVNGTGAAVSFASAATDDDHAVPITALDTGTTATGRASKVMAAGGGVQGGAGCQVFVGALRVPVLSTALQEYDARAGFNDGAGAGGVPGDGVFWFYDRNTSVNWLCRAMNTGVATTVDSGIAVSTSLTFIRLGVFLNGDATRAEFFYSTDKGQTWNFISTAITSANLPFNRTYGAEIGITKSVGTTTSQLFIRSQAYRIMNWS